MNELGPVLIANTERFDFTSRVNGRRYAISLALPWKEPKDGYRVLYVIDGHYYFGSATEMVRTNAYGSDVLVVGIGYPDDPSFFKQSFERHEPLPSAYYDVPPNLVTCSLERLYDLTLPASDEELALQHFPGMPTLKAHHVGGVDDFLSVVETEIKVYLDSRFPIQHAQSALFGHSLGGLTVLRALFTEPGAFRSFIAASPSIWWNQRAVLNGEAGLADAVRAVMAHPRVLICMGADESLASPALAERLGMDMPALEAHIQLTGMVENARQLAARLQGSSPDTSIAVEDYAVFPKLAHDASPWPALARAVTFAFS